MNPGHRKAFTSGGGNACMLLSTFSGAAGFFSCCLWSKSQLCLCWRKQGQSCAATHVCVEGAALSQELREGSDGSAGMLMRISECTKWKL